MPRQYTPGPLPFLPFLSVELTCQQCSVRFLISRARSGTQRFCSRACANRARATSVALACEQCGTVMYKKPSYLRASHHFCTNACAVNARRRPPADRFWGKFEKTQTCWRWTGSTDQRGYGRLRLSTTPEVWGLAHRLSWEVHFGPIPDGLFVLHRCDNPPCVNPEHLFLGTQTDNMTDAAGKGRLATGAQHWSRNRPQSVLRGVDNSSARLSEDDVRTIRTRYAAGGVSHSELAREFGVSRRAIGMLIRRERWKHLG